MRRWGDEHFCSVVGARDGRGRGCVASSSGLDDELCGEEEWGGLGKLGREEDGRDGRENGD